MGGELRIRIDGDRTPPQIDDLEVDDEEWRLPLEAHRDLLRDLTGIDPDDDLTLRELVTIRARLEGYVERANRPAERTDGGDERTADRERDRGRNRDRDRDRDRGRARKSDGPLRALARLLERLRAALSIRETTRSRDDEPSGRRPDADPPYSVERVQHLAAVFRAAAAARRREIVDANTGRAADEAAK